MNNFTVAFSLSLIFILFLFLCRFLWLAPKDKQQNDKNEEKLSKTFVKDWVSDGTRERRLGQGYDRFRGVPLLTFISTDSLSFSRLIILIATFLPITQCTPNLTRPATAEVEECKRVSISFYRQTHRQTMASLTYPSDPCPGSSRGDRGPQIGSSLPSHCSPFASCGRLALAPPLSLSRSLSLAVSRFLLPAAYVLAVSLSAVSCFWPFTRAAAGPRPSLRPPATSAPSAASAAAQQLSCRIAPEMKFPLRLAFNYFCSEFYCICCCRALPHFVALAQWLQHSLTFDRKQQWHLQAREWKRERDK